MKKHALMLKTHQFSRTVQCCSTSIYPLFEHFILAPVSLRPHTHAQSALIGQLLWA